MEADDELRAELTTFQCKECYVYRPPPASSIGHRAELWDVDHWLQEVSLKIVTSDEECTIKMFDFKSGALFAECIVPQDAPLSTVVEAVVDSSRYFALKIEDRACKRHAFIGIGFRERTEASDFNAALYEHTQYLRRKKEAQQRRQAYESTAGDHEVGASGSSQSELSLKPGETITLKLAKRMTTIWPCLAPADATISTLLAVQVETQLSPSGSTTQALPRLTSGTAQVPQFQAKDGGPGQIPLLAPPPTSLSAPLPSLLSGPTGDSAQQPAQTKSDSPELPAHIAEHATQASTQQQDDMSEDTGANATRDSRQASSSLPGSGSQQEATQPAADDWGDFVS